MPPSHHKNKMPSRGKCEDSPPHTPAPTSQHSRAHQHRPPPLRAPAPTAAPAPVLPPRTRCGTAHTRGLTHTHSILNETSQKRIRKNCRGGFSPSTARVAQTHQCGGRRPRTANKKRAEARCARGAGRGRWGGRGAPPLTSSRSCPPMRAWS